MIKIESGLSSYYQVFREKNAREISKIFRDMDKAVKPYSSQAVDLTLYHGTNLKSAKRIVSEGFKMTGARKHSGLFDVGEFGEAVYLSPSESTATFFGKRIIKAKANLKKPLIAIPEKWESAVNRMNATVFSSIIEESGELAGKDVHNKCSFICKRIIKDYFEQKGTDGIFCEDFVNDFNRNTKLLKQNQWAILNPENITVSGVSKNSLTYLKFRALYAIKRLLLLLKK